MLQVGLNAQIIANKTSANMAVGTKVAAVLRALRELNDLKKMFDQFTDAELKTIGFGDGTAGTSNEIGYGIRTPLLAGEDLFKILNGQTPTAGQPMNYASQLQYVSGGQG